MTEVVNNQKTSAMPCIQFVELTNYNKYTEPYGLYHTEVQEFRYDLTEALRSLVPEFAITEVAAMLKRHKVLLQVGTPLRHLGRYFHDERKIYINNNLEKDRFVRTFVHEYAHLLTDLCFPKVPHHGAEFYYCNGELINKLIEKNLIQQNDFEQVFGPYSYKNYLFYKNNKQFNFNLKTLRVGSSIIYNGEVYLRQKGHRGLINCMKVSDGSIIKLGSEVKVLPMLDLSW